MADNYFDLGGTLRSAVVQEVLTRLYSLQNQIGISRVANLTGLDNIGLPVVIAIRPMAKHLSVSQGKGWTQELATISAIMEAMECYHAENPPQPMLRGNYNSLKLKYSLVNPQVFNRGFLQTPLQEYELNWILAHDLVNDEAIYIPHDLINFDSSTILRKEFAYFSISSNGLAAGTTKEEALCHAIYEIIERDCLYKWGLKAPAIRQESLISHDSIESELIKTVLERLSNLNLEVLLWDISAELPVPAFHCTIYNRNILGAVTLFSGSGAHLSQEVALLRALLEAVQSSTSLISGSRDDIYKAYYANQRQIAATLPMSLRQGKKSLRACVLPTFEQSFHKNIEQLLGFLKVNGYENVLYVDHTKQEINVPVVQVFIPNMRFNGSRM